VNHWPYVQLGIATEFEEKNLKLPLEIIAS
jgi:hypothetical protein